MENGLTMDGLKNFIVCRKCKNLEVWGNLADMSSNSYITDADSCEIKLRYTRDYVSTRVPKESILESKMRGSIYTAHERV